MSCANVHTYMYVGQWYIHTTLGAVHLVFCLLACFGVGSLTGQSLITAEPISTPNCWGHLTQITTSNLLAGFWVLTQVFMHSQHTLYWSVYLQPVVNDLSETDSLMCFHSVYWITCSEVKSADITVIDYSAKYSNFPCYLAIGNHRILYSSFNY